MNLAGRCLIAVLLVLSYAVPLHAAEPTVRVDILTPEPIVSGQQVQVQVDVLVPNFFMSAPQFPNIDIPNAIVTLPDVRAQNLVETIGGESFSGIRRLYLVTPQAPGDYVLPPATISFAYAAVPGQATDGSVTLPPVKFTVAGVPGAPAGNVATALTVTQTLDREPTGLKAGDTLVRTVTASAEGMQAMMIPVPDFTAPESVRIYPHDPVLSNEEGSGSLVDGKRIDRVTYAFEKPGSYVLPAVQIDWYDPVSQKPEVAQAPEIAVSVAEAAAFKPAIAPPATPEEPVAAARKVWLKYVPWVAAVVAGFAILAWLVTRALPRLGARRQARRLEYQQSEMAHFRRFQEACHSGNVSSIYSSLDSWSRRANVFPLTDWLDKNGDAATLAEFERLENKMFSTKPDSTPDAPQYLLGGISRARKQWLSKERLRAMAPAALPELNP